jgi:flagellar biosynthetic protein FliQ
VQAFDALLRETLLVTAVLALPALILAVVVGTAVAIVQAATQVQEQTLTVLPKIVIVGALVAMGGAFGMQLCAGLFADAVARVPQLVRAAP